MLEYLGSTGFADRVGPSNWRAVMEPVALKPSQESTYETADQPRL